MASPWVGLERRCPQWMYRWSDINSGPQKCSTLSGYTGKVGWLWHVDLIPACVDVLLLLIVAEVFQNHRRCRKDLGVSRLFSVSLKMIRVFFGRSSTLTVSTQVLCDCVFETVVRVPCSSGSTCCYRPQVVLKAFTMRMIRIATSVSKPSAHCSKRHFNRTSSPSSPYVLARASPFVLFIEIWNYWCSVNRFALEPLWKISSGSFNWFL